MKDSTDDLWFLDTDEDDVGDDLFRHLSDDDVYANEYELVSEPDDAVGLSDSDDFAVSSHHEVQLIEQVQVITDGSMIGLHATVVHLLSMLHFVMKSVLGLISECLLVQKRSISDPVCV